MSTFNNWINKSDTEKIYLCDIEVLQPGQAAENLYLGSSMWFTKPSDTPANRYYEPRVQGIPRFARSMQEIIYGRSMPSFGELVIVNADRGLDTYMADYIWHGRPISVKLGGPDLDSFAEWTMILKGVMGHPGIEDDNIISVDVFDDQRKFQKKIPPNVFTSAGYPNAAGDVIGKPIPLSYGYVNNIEPILINTTNFTYKVNDGAINDVVTAYDDGVSVTIASKDLPNGTFRLQAAPVGRVTCDAQGIKEGVTFLVKVGQCIDHMLRTYAGYSSSDIDQTLLGNFNTDVPYDIGIYISEQTELLSVFDGLITGTLGWYGFNRTGKFEIGQFKAATSIADNSFSDDVEILDFKQRYDERIWWKARLNYDKNWTVQDENSVGGSVTIARREWLKREYRTTEQSDSAVKNDYAMAIESEPFDTFLRNKADADTLAGKILSLFKQRRRIISFGVKNQAYKNKQNDVIYLKRANNRYGLSGNYFRLIGLEEDYNNNVVTMTLWG